MLTKNIKEEFIDKSLQIESLKNQYNNIFDLKEKERIKRKIKLIYNEINKLLDEYNKKEI